MNGFRRFFIFFLIIFFSKGFSFSQEKVPFIPDEEITYIISYNWSFIWIDVGSAKFSVKEKTIKKIPFYVLEGWGKTYKSWDSFFKVRDYYKSVIFKNTLKPVYFVRDIEEGDIKFKITYKFIRKKGLVYAERTGNHGRHHQDTLKVPDNTYDLLSIIYKVRTLDFDSFKKNQKVPVSIMLDRKLENLYFRYLGKEVFYNKKVGKFKTIKIRVLTVPSEAFKGGETMTIWVTDDKNHIPVWIESPISVGAVKVRLNTYKNLKYPLSSKIADKKD